MKHQKSFLTSAMLIGALTLQGCGGSDNTAGSGSALGIYTSSLNGDISAAGVGPEPADTHGMVAQNGWGVFDIDSNLYIGFTSASGYSGPEPEDEEFYTGIAALDGFYRIYEFNPENYIYEPIGEADIVQGNIESEDDWCWLYGDASEVGDPRSLLEAGVIIPESGKPTIYDLEYAFACAEVAVEPSDPDSDLEEMLYVSAESDLGLLLYSGLQIGDIYSEGPDYINYDGFSLTMLSPGNTNFVATGFVGCDLEGTFKASDDDMNIYTVTGTLVEPQFQPVFTAAVAPIECEDAGATFEGVAYLDNDGPVILNFGGEFVNGSKRFATLIEFMAGDFDE